MRKNDFSHPFFRESIAFTTQKLSFFYAFLQPAADYQTVTTLRRFRCTRSAGNYFEISQALGVNGKPRIGQNRY